MLRQLSNNVPRRVRKSSAKKSPSRRSLRMERLEDRALLSVTTAEYAEIQTAYPELELPEDSANINIIEVEAESLSVENLKAAITAAGESTGDDLVVVRTTDEANEITFESENDTIGVNINSTEFGALKVVGFGTQALTINGDQLARVFAIADGNVALANLNITGGSLGNEADSGAGINVTGGTTLVTKSTITYNTAMGAGGGVNVDGGAFTAMNTTISENSSYSDGGGINVASGSFTSTNSTISDNVALGVGGGVNIVDGSFAATGTTISNNNGGGVYMGGGVFTSTNSTISKNTTYSNGGAVYVVGGAFTSTNTTISENSAYCGGGVAVGGGTFSATNTALWGNVAEQDGGAVYVGSAGAFTAVNATIAGNTAMEGAVYVYSEGDDFGTFTATNVILAANNGSNLVGALADGSSNNFLDYYPMFVEGPAFGEDGVLTNADTINLSLRSDSPAINAGSNAAVEGVATDLAGNPRIVNEIVDIGAYEFQEGTDEPFYSTVVDTLNDSFDLTDGEWSLREAIYYASKYETITFAEGLSGTIELTQGELTIDRALAIDGAGLITIDAGQESRVINVSAGTTETPVVLKGLAIQNGNAGYDCGGGIYLNGALDATNVIISGNSADSGAGVYVCAGAFTATNSVIAANAADAYGGGVSVDVGGSFTAKNTTISGNTATNGGGVYVVDVDASFTATNSVITANHGGNVAGTISEESANNLIDDSASFICTPEFDTDGNLTNAEDVDLHLFVDSDAIDKGDNAAIEGIATDLDGNKRVYNGTVDIGAYEFQGYYVVDTLNDSFDLTDGEWSLREAIYYAAENEYETITFAADLSGSIELALGELTVDKAVVIDGDGRITIDAGGESRALNVTGGTAEKPVALKNLTIQNGVAPVVEVEEGEEGEEGEEEKEAVPTIGGGILVNGVLTATSVKITNNAADNGAGVYVAGGAFTAIDSTISANTAKNGAAVYVADGAFTANNSTISENTASENGGAVYSCASFTSTGSTFSDNAARNGGAVYVAGGTFTANNSAISDNTASENGGAVYVADGTFASTGSTFTENTADYNGGAVYVMGGTFTSTDSTFTKNEAKDEGGAVFAAGETFTATGSTFTENSAITYGGGVLVELGAVTISKSTFTGNTADPKGFVTDETYGSGAGVCVKGGIFAADATTFTDNVAKASGGAVAVAGGSATLSNLTISGNEAYNGGAVAVGNEGASLTATNVTMSGNSATFGGAVATANNGAFTAVSSKFTGNTAKYYGGAFVVDSGSTVTVKNSAISANVAQFGGAVSVNSGSTFNAVNDTISGNSVGDAENQGGGVLVAGTFNATNTIVAWNYGGNVAGSITGNNNITNEDIRLFVNAPTFDSEGNLTNADTLDLNLRIHSLAIDRGSNDAAAGLSTDLNGDARIKNNTVDIGAYEYQGNYYSTVVDTLEDVVDDHDGKWSLREALNNASDYPYITFAPELNGTIKLSLGVLAFNKAISIDGDGRITIDAQSKHRVAYMSAGTTSAPIVLKGLTLQNGYDGNGENGGGAIYLSGALTTENVTIKGSYAQYGGGGAVYINSGTFFATTTTITENSCDLNGGGVYVGAGATFKANSVVISKNTANWFNGGGVYVFGGTFNATNVTIVANKCSNGLYTGGGVAVDHSGTMVAYNSIIVRNSSDNIFSYGSTIKGTNNLSNYNFGSGNYTYNANDRLFKNFDRGDYRLQNRSQAWNKGNSARAQEAGMTDSSVDMLGNPRFSGSSIDIGAYEFDERLYAPEDVTTGVYNISTRTVALTWTDATYNETGFRVEYSVDGGQTWRLTQLLGANTTSCVLRNIKQNATYQFRVQALLDGKFSEWGYSETLNTTPTAPVAPSDFTFGEYDSEAKTVSTSWQDNSDNETGFRVEYSTDGGSTWRLAKVVGANTTLYTMSGVKADSTYNFRVCALAGSVKSKWAYSDTLDTTEEVVNDVPEAALDVFNDAFNVPAVGAYALTLPVAVPTVAQVAVRDVVFESFAKDDAIDFNDDSVQTTAKASERSASFVELFDDLLELEF